jgi:hypothetical protein
MLRSRCGVSQRIASTNATKNTNEAPKNAAPGTITGAAGDTK